MEFGKSESTEDFPSENALPPIDVGHPIGRVLGGFPDKPRTPFFEGCSGLEAFYREASFCRG